MLLIITPARTYGLNSSGNIPFLLRLSVLVIPVLIPMRKDISIPNVLYDVVIDCTCKLILELLFLLVSPLDQDGS